MEMEFPNAQIERVIPPEDCWDCGLLQEFLTIAKVDEETASLLPDEIRVLLNDSNHETQYYKFKGTSIYFKVGPRNLIAFGTGGIMIDYDLKEKFED